MIPIAVLASGRGSNFQAIIDGIKAKEVNAEIKVLITDKKDAKAIDRAKKAKIPVEIVEKEKFNTREEMDLHIKKLLDKYKVQLVVLAGYMRLIRGKELLESYKNKIINIHPSLLPAFPGVDAQTQAFEYGCRISGLTVHFVDEQLDHGPIIYQEAIDISDCKSADEVAKKILEKEHEAYKKIINSFTKGTYAVEGRKAKYTPFVRK